MMINKFYTNSVHFDTQLLSKYILILVLFYSIMCLFINALDLEFLDHYYLMNDNSSNNSNNLGNNYGNNPNFGSNNNNSGGDNSNMVSNAPEYDRKMARKWMHDKLLEHRLSKANAVPYETSLDDKFTPQEHEFICEEVTKYSEEVNPDTYYAAKIKGGYPDRTYAGKITLAFINIFKDD